MSRKKEPKDDKYCKQSHLYNEVSENNPWMLCAKEAAIKFTKTPIFPIGIVAVKDGKVVISSANGNGYHEENVDTPEHKKGCKRRYVSEQREKEGKQKLMSGEGFDLCPGCNVEYHAEAKMVREATDTVKLEGATVYMYGHWWCCGSCWAKMEAVGIKEVYIDPKFRNKDETRLWRGELENIRNSNDQ